MKKVLCGILVTVTIVLLGLTSCSNSDVDSYTSDIDIDFYAFDVEAKDVINGSRTEVIGQYAISRAKSTDVTLEILTDWYNDVVIKNNLKWAVILYTDKNDNTGAFANQGFVLENTVIEQDSAGDYVCGDSTNATCYYLRDGKLAE